MLYLLYYLISNNCCNKNLYSKKCRGKIYLRIIYKKDLVI